MLTIERLTTDSARSKLDELILLLQDSVENGASVGFLPPLSYEEAHAYWTDILEEFPRGARLLLVAVEDERIVGSVQLELATKRNAPHRAEVQKLMVHSACRNKGIGGQLMQAIERFACDVGRTLLVLDTRRGDSAERLYAKLGYVQAGIIPQYALSAAGSYDDTVYFYKLI
jgi:ribosomal protein S18 acetylase RimI-like enzyme